MIITMKFILIENMETATLLENMCSVLVSFVARNARKKRERGKEKKNVH